MADLKRLSQYCISIRTPLVAQFLDDIEEGLKTPMEQNWSALWSPAVRRALFIAVGLTVLQQVTGINTIIYYGPQILSLREVCRTPMRSSPR